MKSTGIVRKIDRLGRIVIPIELRNVLGIEDKDSLEIFVEGNQIIFQKFKSYDEKVIATRFRLKELIQYETDPGKLKTLTDAIELLK
ncbi:AbrB/MazE/SpoVT family DNA-binding domain-containing protein [Viridibacillus sp. YIM B01967]|uniref:AbrB/MazE/SpoVT family DNA-binding domain-containing protein n=1 Tax=Viridibacillus soli TaxID=2798301 RepID=A0ABS1H243_9BACL|nr:AbrB/MazE/SpoVT family DNA-binding domain-containing protein [Viridibacillus soli]MBK3493479.1 AbrB/MazE/SpoVT family DNA-binding domain-containing protein [Viridibacillus soli]